MIPLRILGIKALQTVIKIPKNVNIIEKNLYEISKKEDKVVDASLTDLYNDGLYQVIGDISEGVKLGDIIKYVKKGELWWRHSSFREIKFVLEERDEFIVKPFEVEEGIMECKGRVKTGKMKGQVCGSLKVYSYAKQMRGCDEGTSVVCTCASCGNNWTISG